MKTRIPISTETKHKLKKFGNKGEIYDEILQRILKHVHEHMIRVFLMNPKGTITLEEARRKAQEKWKK